MTPEQKEKRNKYMREYLREYYKTAKGAEVRKKSAKKWNESDACKMANKKYQKENLAFRVRHSKRVNELQKIENDGLRKCARNFRQSYTISDDDLILNGKPTLAAVAKMIGRSLKAVQMRKARLLNKQYALNHR